MLAGKHTERNFDMTQAQTRAGAANRLQLTRADYRHRYTHRLASEAIPAPTYTEDVYEGRLIREYDFPWTITDGDGNETPTPAHFATLIAWNDRLSFATRLTALRNYYRNTSDATDRSHIVLVANELAYRYA